MNLYHSADSAIGDQTPCRDCECRQLNEQDVLDAIGESWRYSGDDAPPRWIGHRLNRHHVVLPIELSPLPTILSGDFTIDWGRLGKWHCRANVELYDSRVFRDPAGKELRDTSWVVELTRCDRIEADE